MAYDFNAPRRGAAPVPRTETDAPAERPAAGRVPLSLEEMGKLCQLITAAQRELRGATRGIAEEFSLGHRGAWIIGMISKGIVFPSDLTDMMRISRSLMAAELERLVQAGLITSRKNERDGRRLELALTPLGEGANDRLGRDIDRMFQERLSSYSREQILLCMRILTDVSAGGNLKVSEAN